MEKESEELNKIINNDESSGNPNQGEPNKIIDQDGNEHISAVECEINGRIFVITTSRKIFEKGKDGVSYKECTADDEETKFLQKYVKAPRSLDVEIDY